MKKLITSISFCIILFSATACNSSSDVEKLKGCWEYTWGSQIEIGNNYQKKIQSGDKLDIVFKDDGTHIMMIITHPELIKMVPDAKEVYYIHKDSITEKTFRRSKEKESPDEGLEFTRIQCPK